MVPVFVIAPPAQRWAELFFRTQSGALSRETDHIRPKGSHDIEVLLTAVEGHAIRKIHPFGDNFGNEVRGTQPENVPLGCPVGDGVPQVGVLCADRHPEDS